MEPNQSTVDPMTLLAALDAAQAGQEGKLAWRPRYRPWRHGGWYVVNVRFPGGACGTVSRNSADRKWRVVEDPEPEFEKRQTYTNRDEAAHALAAIVISQGGTAFP